ncbi:MAG TPA: hypothetical protein VER98_16725 [Terriglobia bacterium]|nr:hypothetical protein [Terriglobia bacterium]
MRRDITIPFALLIGFPIAGLLMATPAAFGQASKGSTPDLTGVYELVSNNVTLPGGLKNAGSPEAVSLLPAAAAKAKATDLSLDTARDCQIIGPFRMMAWEGNKIDLLPSPNTGRIFMLFENYFLGLFRETFLDRQHDAKRPATWNGDSIGHWEGDTLVVDTVNFNEYTWLNSAGAPHSEALRLIERYRPVSGGQFLEVKVTAEDAKVLTRPYTYTRYYRKVETEIPQYVCTDDLVKPEIPAIQ